MSAYKKYPAYKDSGVEWLGEVPEGWGVMPLKRISLLCTEREESRSFQVGLEHIESWSGRFIEGEAEFEGRGTAFRQGDILFGKLRPYLAKAWLSNCLGEAVGDFHVIRVQSPHVPAFVHRLILSRDVISLIDGSTYGAKMPRASWEFIGTLPVPIPAHAEQTAIAAFLDRETAKIDRLIAAQRRLIDLLREKRSALISHVVTKGLNPDAPMKDSGVEWLGKVPEHWMVMPFKWQIERNDGGVWGVDLDGDDDTIVLRSTDQTVDGRWQVDDPARRKLSAAEKNAALLAEGDLVVTKSSGSALHIGKTTIVTPEIAAMGCCYSNFMQRIRTKPSFKSKLAWYVMNNYISRLQFDLLSNSTTGLANLNGTMIGQMLLAIPPVWEQTAIADFLDSETAKIDALIAKTEKAIELAQERRSALISAAVTGKIDVRDAAVQSPVDQETAPV